MKYCDKNTMPSCSVRWCGKSTPTSSLNNDGITFHRYPHDPHIKNKWINATRRDKNWFPSTYTVICSRHFTEDCFVPLKNRRRLLRTAIPTLYLPVLSDAVETDTPTASASKTELPGKLSDQPETKSPPGSSQQVSMETATKEKKGFPESPSEYVTDTSDKKNLRGRIFELCDTIKQKNKRIKNLSEKSRHMAKRLAILQNVLENFKKKNKVKNPLPAATAASRDSSDAGDSDSDGLIEDPSDISDLLVFNEPGRSKSTGTAEQQPSTSASADLQYQPSRYSMVCAQETSQLEEIIIKEEISDEEKNQCRLCLSVGRRMQELAEYAPLYLKLLFENNYQNTTVPSYAYQMLACWECVAELRRIRRFQDKVRRANTAFETSQNQKCENLSNLSTIIIGESDNANAGDGERRQSDMEACVQSIKEEAIEAEVEETYVPDPLEVTHEPGRKEAQHYNVEIEREADVSAPTTKQAAKRAQPEPKTARNAAKRTKTDKNDPKTSQAEEDNDPKPAEGAETDCDAIFAKVKIEIDELEKILAERRNKESFKSMKFKCEPCVLGFTDHNRLLEHHRNFHDEEVGSCECDICERRFTDERQLAAHQRNHFVKFVCRLCQFECYTKTGRAIHYKRHKGALQGASLESILRQRLTSEQRASASGSSREPST